MKWLLFTVASLWLSLANAEAPQKYCFCEIGNYPESQQVFFKVGCDMWLGAQRNCAVQETVPQNHNYSQMEFPRGSQLVVGYVGHWSSSYEMINYLDQVIVPAMNKHHLSAVVDNTACLGMDHPEAVQHYIRGLNLARDQALDVRGNQTVSVGKWGDFMPSLNFWAHVSSRRSEVSYPNCKAYEDYPCGEAIQLNQSARCLDKNKEVSQLRCCKVPYDGGRRPSHKIIWATPDRCAQ